MESRLVQFIHSLPFGVENDAKEAVDQVLLHLKDSSDVKLAEKIYHDTADKLKTLPGQEVRERISVDE